MAHIKKRQLFNIVMVVIIAAIVFAGVMTVGSLRGWFLDENTIQVCDKRGNANIERSGIAYSLSNETFLINEDEIQTLNGSSVTLTIQSAGNITLGEDTRLRVSIESKNSIVFEVSQGEIFADIKTTDGLSVALRAADRVVSTQCGVFSLTAQTGSHSIYVYGGDVEVDAQEVVGNTKAIAGQAVSLLTGDSNETVCSVYKLTATSLNEFQIEQIKAANNTIDLCYTDEELDTVVADRQAEMLAMQTEREEYEQQLIAQGGNVLISIEGNDTEAENVSSQTPQPSNEVNPSSKEPTATAQPKVSSTKEPTSATAAPSAEPTNKPTPVPTPKPEVHTCAITIRCDTILDNMENLTEGKSQYVPANGTILATSSIQFYEGETVFEVLKRACKAAGLQMEYEWFPIYESYYIEGINHLYEFDCGSESGWMYKVNGWFPNYGCSSYTLEDGDKIVWCYTCKGLGADVGGSVY